MYKITRLICAGVVLWVGVVPVAQAASLPVGRASVGRSDLTAAGMAFDVDTATGSVLRVDGAVAPGVTLSFLGTSGVLELADGIIQP